MRRLSRLVLVVAMLLGAWPTSAIGQGGSVEGTARAEATDGGGPIPFALVRLVAVAPGADSVREAITSDAGRFRFADVPAGEYRLRLLRIGYAPVTSAVLRVAPGAPIQQELRGAAQAVRLPTTVVRGGRCLQGAELAADPELATLLDEARKGVDIRRGLELRYRYTRRTQYTYGAGDRPGGAATRTDTLHSVPDGVVAREDTLRKAAESGGFGEKRLVKVPTEKLILDPWFQRDHCFEATRSEDGATLGLAFRPTHVRKRGLEVRGTLWLDTASFLVRRLEIEHLDRDRPMNLSRVDYGDVTVGASALRLPVGGDGVLGSGKGAVPWRYTLVYHDFEEARPH